MLDGLSEQGQLVRSPEALKTTVSAGRVAALMSIEYPSAFAGTTDTVDTYRAAGIRSITFSMSGTDPIAEAAGDEPAQARLSDFGRSLVARMNDAGLIVDVSHVPDPLQRDIARASRLPVVVSHTCARALNEIPRCVPDDVIEAVAEGGGVVAVTFYAGFASADYAKSRARAQEEFAPIAEAIKSRYGAEDEAAEREVYAVWRGRSPLAPRVDALADHIDHIVKVAGADHVGIGSDAGGSREMAVRDVQDATGWRAITYELLRRGYAEEDVEKILGGNLLRVYERVHAGAR
jgi:membrane dipeptidase